VPVALLIFLAANKSLSVSFSDGTSPYYNRYAEVSLSLLMKHCIRQSRGPNWFNEIGNVNLPHSSGVWTIFCVSVLHDLHTEAQEMTTERAGQEISFSSTLQIISSSNSDCIFAGCPSWIGSSDVRMISATICDFVWRCECLLPTLSSTYYQSHPSSPWVPVLWFSTTFLLSISILLLKPGSTKNKKNQIGETEAEKHRGFYSS